MNKIYFTVITVLLIQISKECEADEEEVNGVISGYICIQKTDEVQNCYDYYKENSTCHSC